MIVHGSIPGAPKRIVKIRLSARLQVAEKEPRMIFSSTKK
jgi:ribosomal protein L3